LLRREQAWPEITYGTILASNLAEFGNRKGEKQIGKNHLFAILVTETAHMIWKIRCERVFQKSGDNHTRAEMENKWLHCINTCLKMDRLQTDHLKYGKKAIKMATVLQT
jgi:hypothetical protein